MNLSEAQKLERKQAEESDYYNVLLWDEAARRQVRVRTCCWVLDAERKPVTNEDGKRTYRDAHEVALDVWAAYGADDHTLICLQLGPVLPANAYSLATNIALSPDRKSVVSGKVASVRVDLGGRPIIKN